MVFFILILFAVTIIGARISGPGSFNTDYLKKKNTTSVNGIFVVLVLFSHYAQYADLGGALDDPYLLLRFHLKQMVVATFMFYSGYGMMEAIKSRGKAYVRRIVSKFWQLLLKFDIAVVLYIAVNSVLGVHYPAGQTLLAFTTWTAVGNSNWYITAILILYAIMFISFMIGFTLDPGNRGRTIGLTLMFLLTILAVWFQIVTGRPDYCYNTMLLLPVGCLYSEYHTQIEKAVMRSETAYLFTLAAAAGIYIFTFFHRESYGITGYTLWGIAFISLVLLITMKVSIYNRILEWTGSHIFGIYILQRLPMIVLDHYGMIEDHKYISLIEVMVITFIIAALFQKYTDRMINWITTRHKSEGSRVLF